MASEKNERLVNLVIALLATKKYLTKAQIFKAVAGYEGSQEAMDRMFERDKEELRSLGIQIEMKSIDPLFDDEIGYRIIPERYRFDLGPLSTEEVTILALAAQAWKESALKDVARATSIRLESLGIVSDFSELSLVPTIHNVPENLTAILEAIDMKRSIEFKYLNQNDKSEVKKVAPYGIYSQRQKWYLYAADMEKKELRSYRLDRIEGEIKRTSKNFQPESFQLPTSHFPEISVLLEIRRDFALDLQARAEILNNSEEWIRCRLSFLSENDAVAQVLKHSPNVKVLEPVAIVAQVTKALSKLVALHGS